MGEPPAPRGASGFSATASNDRAVSALSRFPEALHPRQPMPPQAKEGSGLASRLLSTWDILGGRLCGSSPSSAVSADAGQVSTRLQCYAEGCGWLGDTRTS